MAIRRRDLVRALRYEHDADGVARRLDVRGKASRNYVNSELHHLSRDGLAVRDGDGWRLTKKGEEYAEAGA